MRARKPRWYSLQQMKIRQSWNKHNLFNLVRKNLPSYRFSKTFFQQKWLAKGMTRAYHGPHIKERDWARMFDRRLYSAVDMPPDYLAKWDGSEQAAGRGSGLHHEAGRDEQNARTLVSAYDYSRWEKERLLRVEATPVNQPFHARQMRQGTDRKGTLISKPIYDMTPYMQMAFAPLERRLDVAIFRAMFASSTLQAKQFCTHGAVKVNGKTMRYGAYKLNPGDMFQVNVDHVLYATGRTKTPEHAKFIAGEDEETLRLAEEAKKAKEAEASENSEEAAADAPAEAEAEAAAEPAAEEADAEASSAEDAEGRELTEEEQVAANRKQLKALVRSAKELITDGEGLNPRKKRQLRAFMSETKRAISRAGRHDESANLAHGDVMDHLSALLKDFKLDGEQVEAVESSQSGKQPQQQEGEQNPKASEADEKFKDKAAMATIDQLITSKEVRAKVDFLSKEEQRALADLLRRDAENPIDESKPYWTPWEPRPFIAPWAFIPRYLEVNQNICAAVYLRHPVARRGLAEVPTPFPYETNQLAFNWYLRRR